MKRVLIPFKLVDGYPVVYNDHPVFNGTAAFDCGHVPGNSNPNQRLTEPMVCSKLKVREFNGEGECIAAIQDYKRELGKEAKPFEAFVLIPKISI